MFVLEMAVRFILWGLLLHVAFAQVGKSNQPKIFTTTSFTVTNVVLVFWDAFQNDNNDVQPTELQPASAESSREAATSVAEPGSSRQEKCKKRKILTFSEKTGYDINVCDFSVLSVFQIVKFQNGDCPASDGNRGVCFTGLFLLQDHCHHWMRPPLWIGVSFLKAKPIPNWNNNCTNNLFPKFSSQQRWMI